MKYCKTTCEYVWNQFSFYIVSWYIKLDKTCWNPFLTCNVDVGHGALINFACNKKFLSFHWFIFQFSMHCYKFGRWFDLEEIGLLAPTLVGVIVAVPGLEWTWSGSHPEGKHGPTLEINRIRIKPDIFLTLNFALFRLLMIQIFEILHLFSIDIEEEKNDGYWYQRHFEFGSCDPHPGVQTHSGFLSKL